MGMIFSFLRHPVFLLVAFPLSVTAGWYGGAGSAKAAAPVAPTTVAAPSPPARAAPAAQAPATGPVPFSPPAPPPEGPLGDAARRGRDLVMRTWAELPDHVGNKLSCTNCHLQAGTVPGASPWVGLTAAFPEYRSRNARVNTLEDRINDCFERSMNGTALPTDSADLRAISAYIASLSSGVPVGRSVEGRGFARLEQPATPPDPARGKEVYAQKCVACHGLDGAGISGPDGAPVFPALWGERSFNIGAGMARLDTAAAFIHANMPMGQGRTLTPAEAYDVAAYVIHQNRPDFTGKSKDWPKGGKPRDARY